MSRSALRTGTLLAGAAEACITPNRPVELAGYHGVRVAKKVRDGLFSLYSLLRIDPLQQALTQGLRDIAVMVASEAMPNAR